MFSKVSLRVRLVLLFVFIFGTTNIIFNSYTFNFMIEVLQSDFDDALFNYAVDISEGIELGRNEALELIPINLDQGKILPFPLGQALIQIRHSSGTIMARLTSFDEVNFPYKKAFEAFAKGEDANFRTIEFDAPFAGAEAHSYRLLSVPLDNSPTPQLALQIAVPMIFLENQIENRLNRLRFGIPIVLLFAALGGIFVSGRALAPVKQMTNTAKNISGADLSQRIPVPKNNDEIKDLSLTLNHMLDRLEAAFKSQERFIADASHQLLTPLALLRAEVELKSREVSSGDLNSFFTSQLGEIDHLSRIVKDMLFLAKVDSGREILHKVNVPADEILTDLLPNLERAWKRKNIEAKISLHGDEHRHLVSADIPLLKHLLTNLIENAIKYSPDKSVILMEIFWSEKSTEIRITDQGPGIPEEVKSNLFDRFKRGRLHETQVKGFGLGLSIAKKIADLHGADLSFEDAKPTGTICKLVLPSSRADNKSLNS